MTVVEKKYSNAIIYRIDTIDGLYIGSTIHYQTRKAEHKHNLYNESRKDFKFQVYKNIRKNNGIYVISIYKPYPCNNSIELRKEERRVADELKSNLNTYKPYVSIQERKKIKKLRSISYYNENRELLKEKQRQHRAKKKLLT